MNTYKVMCKVDFDDNNGIVLYPLYIKEINEIEAERQAKFYWLLDYPEKTGKNVAYYGVNNINLI